MTTTAFTDAVTLTAAAWFNDADTVTYAGLTTVAGTNTITATGPASFTTYATRQRWLLIPAATNTGATTVNVSGAGARNIFKNGLACTGGELQQGMPALLVDDGTRLHVVGSASSPTLRSYLAGLTLSTAGASTTMTTAAGQATDSTNAVTMNLASAVGKTTSAWAVGTGNGGLDTGAIANGTWYHFWLVMRPDTNVVDVLFSLSASAPTMPASYTYKRRIGSGLTNGSGQWVLFTQDGDYFRLSASVRDINSTNPGTSSVTATLGSVPTGVNVFAMMNVVVDNNATNSTAVQIYLRDLAASDEAPSISAAPGDTFGIVNGTSDRKIGIGSATIRTNTSAQIGYRISASDANTTVQIVTLGWTDRRGRDS